MDNNTVQVTEATTALLAELSDRNKLSKAALIEVLVSQAHAIGWTVLTPISASESIANELIDFEELKSGLNEEQFVTLCEFLEKAKVKTWVGLGRLGAGKVGNLKGIGEYTLNTLRTTLIEQNVLFAH
jgi:hypothetical protein